MEKDEVIQKLTQMFDDSDGILVQVGSRAEFNKQTYQELLNLLSLYNRLIGDDSCIDRHIAGCLIVLDSFLQGLIDHFQYAKHPGLLEVSTAHAKLIDIMGELMPS